jgi:hypothetical protein
MYVILRAAAENRANDTHTLIAAEPAGAQPAPPWRDGCGGVPGY